MRKDIFIRKEIIITESGKPIVIGTDNIGNDILLPGRWIIDVEERANTKRTFDVFELEKDVTLTFRSAGMIKTEIPFVLRGADTWIDALPDRQIFDGDISFDGLWNMERSYPQWFGVVTYSTIDEAECASVGSESAINKAIELRVSGEVFLPRGAYCIKNAIKMPAGIQLVGDVGIGGSFTNINEKIRAYPNPEYDHDLNPKVEKLLDVKYVKSQGSIVRGTAIVANFEGELPIPKDKDTDIDSPNGQNYAVEINTAKIDTDNTTEYEWYYNYPTVGTLIKNIRFYNRSQARNCRYGGELKRLLLRGVICYGSATFDNVKWDSFSQAVYFPKYYSDCKCVVNCHFDFSATKLIESDKKSSDSKEQDESGPDLVSLYAFDMGFLGDALFFQHNHIIGDKNKGLRLNCCGSGIISDNIIRKDILIESSQGIIYSANHMEDGATLEIRHSNVTTSNNYFIKGKRPSVSIVGCFDGAKRGDSDQSVVNMQGDMFIYYDSKFYQNSLKTNSGFVPVSEYDIAIDGFTILNLSNEYRYWKGNGFDTMKPYGIKIQRQEWVSTIVVEDSGKETTEREEKVMRPLADGADDFEAFNERSYSLSQFCKIGSGFRLDNQYSIGDCKESSGWCTMMQNANTCWVLENAKLTGDFMYRYSYEGIIYWDRSRGIVLSDNAGIRKLSFTVWGSGEDKLTLTQFGSGALLRVRGFGNGAMLRLIRRRYVSPVGVKVLTDKLIETAIVDIPMKGNEMLYDNGKSISGFGWITVDNLEDFVCNKGIQGAEYHGSNVTCRATASEVEGYGWKEGDIIVNINDGSVNVIRKK